MDLPTVSSTTDRSMVPALHKDGQTIRLEVHLNVIHDSGPRWVGKTRLADAVAERLRVVFTGPVAAGGAEAVRLDKTSNV
jgi:hypothetical protein